MVLTEVTGVPGAALPVAALKEHLRMGSGFAMAPDQDGLLEAYLRAAMAAIEGRIGKALIERRFRLVLEYWRGGSEQPLPLAPVGAIEEVVLVDAGGVESVVAPSRYRLVRDLHRPKLAGMATVLGGALPDLPPGGRVEIGFEAGFGPGWDDLPADLRQAVLLLAAEYYEHRHEDAAAQAGLPRGVAALVERWRQVRILGGRGR
ncbi:head-tail connector protein [Pseudogemmobacter sonorensis]|uniref:head-tail connector protein n=1 Tax=Pseudogemmobacter sonorensis TaxID=2989681 RepID=UPI00369910D0